MFKRVDKPLLITIAVLLVFGLVLFSSAALGVLAVNEIKFYSVLRSQLMFALLGGAFALSLGLLIPYQLYRKYAYHLFGIALFITLLVFIPGLSVYHGGAHRWIDLHFITIQPSEGLKITFVMVVALWCSTKRNLFKDWRYGLLPFCSTMVFNKKEFV